jgi:hypothetical protein
MYPHNIIRDAPAESSTPTATYGAARTARDRMLPETLRRALNSAAYYREQLTWIDNTRGSGSRPTSPCYYGAGITTMPALPAMNSVPPSGLIVIRVSGELNGLSGSGKLGAVGVAVPVPISGNTPVFGGAAKL